MQNLSARQVVRTRAEGSRGGVEEMEEVEERNLADDAGCKNAVSFISSTSFASSTSLTSPRPTTCPLFISNQREKLFARLHVFAERAEHGAGYGLRVLLFHAAHHHAQVPRFDHDAYTQRRNILLDGARNLVGQTFLDLQPPREHIHQPRNFRQA